MLMSLGQHTLNIHARDSALQPSHAKSQLRGRDKQSWGGKSQEGKYLSRGKS